MILLWGSPLDQPLAAVREVLQRAEIPHFLLDPRRVLETELELTIDGTVPRGTLKVGEHRIALEDVRAVYLRPPDPGQIPAVARAGRQSSSFQHAMSVHDTLRVFTELANAVVVNPLSRMASNCSKPYQAQLIEAAGFATPETLLTTDSDSVRAFYGEHGQVIYKSISSVRSVVGPLDSATLARIERVQNCPTQFQQRIPGVDHRVHVIGDQVFAARIESDAVDYRYARRSGSSARITETALAADCHARCRALAEALGLPVAGIDLRQTPVGTWVCFEVNPSPAYTYYPQHEEMARALAALLSNAARRDQTKPEIDNSALRAGRAGSRPAANEQWRQP